MKVRVLTLKSFLLSLGLLVLSVGCSHIEHSADVVKEEKVVTPVSKVLNKTRNQILQNKNALRIAFLKLEWGVKNSLAEKRNAIVLDSGIVTFIGQERSKWDRVALARLHGQLVPELYQLLRLVESKNLNLYVVCVNSISCDILKQNLAENSLKEIHFLTPQNISSLRNVRPYLVITSKESLFDSLTKESSWTSWRRQWVKVEQVEYSSLLGPDDLARVVPTVHEF